MSLDLDPSVIWRDFTTDGIPASGAHDPRKVDIRQFESAMRQAVIALLADADPGLELPNLLIRASDVGAGAPNAIQATTNLPVPAGDATALIALNIFEANTGSPVTVSFNGGAALTIKTIAGNDVEVGGLVGNVLGVRIGTTFQLFSDQSSAALLAAVEAAAERAEEARDIALGAVPNVFVPTIAALKAVDTTTTTDAYLTDPARAGQFIFRTGDYSAEVAADTAEGIYVPSTVSGSGAMVGCWVRQFAGDASVKWFRNGSDDATAIAAMASLLGYVIFFEGSYSVQSNMTVSVPVTVQSGVTISVASGVTLTFGNGHSFATPLQHVFTGTGSVAGLWEAYPEWFGAKTDYATDATAAILKAAASLASEVVSGGTLRFTERSYLWDGASVIELEQLQKIKGENTSIRITGSGSRFCTLSSYCRMSGMRFDRVDTPATFGSNIKITGSHITVNDLSFSGSNIAIEVENTASIVVYDFRIFDAATVGVFIHGFNGDLFFSDFLITSNTPTNFSLGAIRILNRVEALVMCRGDVIGGAYPMLIESAGVPGDRTAFSHFTDVFFDGGEAGGASLSGAVSCRFTACWFSNRSYGVEVTAGCDDITFANCEFINNSQSGAVVSGDAKRTRFIGCTAHGNSNGTPGFYSGFSINPGVTDFVIQGCTATSSLGFGTQAYGILVNTGDSDRYIITGNLVSGNSVAGVSDNGTGANKLVQGNF